MSSLPESHPPVDASKTDAKCPVTGQKGDFVPANEGDSRSPCPALNTMANHGYLNRDGKNISAQEVKTGLQECYGLSSPLAYFLSYGGYLLLGQSFRRISLYEIGRHGKIEHDASLVHHDTPEGQDYAPPEIDQTLVEALMGDARPSPKDIEAKNAAEGTDERPLFSVEDAARARIRRETQCRPVTSKEAKLARGEMSIILGVFSQTSGTKTGAPTEWFRRWFSEERLPEGWKPDHSEGLLDVVGREKSILKQVEKLRADEAGAKKDS